jgi:hypothetical protein
MPISDYNEVFDEPTPPRAAAADGEQAAAETPAEPPAAPSERRYERTFAEAHPKAEAPTEMDKGVLDRWQWQLRATAGKAVAAQRRAREAMQAWERLVADARNAGVPDRLLMAAALEADVDLPASE